MIRWRRRRSSVRLRKVAARTLARFVAASLMGSVVLLGFGGPAFADNGSISGTVSTSGSSPTPLIGVCVNAFPASGSGGGFATTITGGVYTIVGLAPGTYYVRADPTCGGNATYATQQLANVVVTSLGNTSGTNFSLVLGGSISGTVSTGSGSSPTPIGSVCVDAYPSASGTGNSSTTISNGTYTITNLAPGTYSVFADPTCNGTISSTYATQQLFNVIVAAGNTPTSVNFSLVVAGSITGTISTGGSSPTPLIGMCVSTFELGGGTSGGFATTVSGGAYTLAGLAPGSYTVGVDPTCGGSITSTYASQQRTPVTVIASTPTSENFSLVVAGSISGTVSSGSGSSPTLLSSVCVSVFVAGSFNNVGYTTTGSNGTYTITGLAPGSYSVQADPTCGGNNSSTYIMSPPTNLSVTAGNITSGTNFSLVLGGSISGTVSAGTGSSSTALSGVCVYAYPMVGGSGGGATTGSNGSYTIAGLVPGSYTVQFNTSFGFGCPNQTYGSVYYSSTSITGTSQNNASTVTVSGGATASSISVALQASNITGTVSLPGGGAASNSFIQVYPYVASSSTSSGPPPQPVASTSSASNGSYSIFLPDGTWTVNAQPPFGSSGASSSSVNITVQGGVLTQINGVAESASTSVNVTLASNNVAGTIKTAGGAVVVNSFVSASGPNFQQILGAFSQTDTNGKFGLHLSDGSFTLSIQPPQGGTGVQTNVGIVVAGGVLTSVSSGPAVITAGALVITMPSANVTGTVTDASNHAVVGGSINVSQNGQFVQGGFSQTDGSGGYSVFLPAGTYTITAQPPNGTTTSAAVSITVTLAGSPPVITQINGQASSGPANIALTTPNVSGTVKTSSGQAVSGASIFVYNTSTNSSVPGGNTTTSSSGVFALNLPTGTYSIQVSPPPGSSLTQTQITITVASDGSVSPSPISVVLPSPNVSGTVFAPNGTTAVGQAQINVTNQSNGQYLNGTFTQTASDGSYQLFLAPGTYSINAQPPQSNPNGYAASSSIVTIGTSGTITSGSANISLTASNISGHVYGPGSSTTGVSYTGINVSNAATGQPLSNGFASSASDGSYAIKVPDGTYTLNAQAPFPNPNNYSSGSTTVTVLNGAITAVNGSPSSGPADIHLSQSNVLGEVIAPGSGNVGVSGSFIQVVNSVTGQFLNVFANTDNSGNFATALPAGTYQLTAQPSFNNTAHNASATVTVVIATNGSVTSATNAAGASVLVSGSVVIQLVSPTVFGQVLDPSGGAVSNVPINVVNNATQQFLNSGFTGTDQSGNFALVLANGSYTVTAQPPFDNVNGLGVGSTTITVAGGVLTGATNPIVISLTKANVHGVVWAPGMTGKQGVANIGINVQSSSGQYLPGDFAGTAGDGSFSLTLPPGTYTLTAFPPPGLGSDVVSSITVTVASDGTTTPSSTDITLKSANITGTVTSASGPMVNVFVQAFQSNQPVPGAFAQSGSDGSFGLSLPDGTYTLQAMPQSSTTVTQATVTITVVGGQLQTPGSANILLGAPNVTGQVTDGTNGIPFTSINVFNNTTNQYLDNIWANTDQSGHYGISLPAGTYTLTARAPFNGATTLGAGSATVIVPASGSVVSNITLPASNVTGTVKDSGANAIGNSFIEVRNDATQQDLQNAFASTNFSGAFGLSLPDGTYDLIVHPPFNGTSNVTSTTVTVTITGGVVTAVTGTSWSSGPVNIVLGAPAVAGVVQDPSGAPLSNVYLQVFNSSGQPIPYSGGTGLNGKFGLSLPGAGTYTIVAYPSPGSSLAPFTTAAFTYDGTTPINETITFAAPNVTGIVYGPDGITVEANTPIGVLNSSGQFVTGIYVSTDANGRFSLTLAPGTYTVVAFPPAGTSLASGQLLITAPATGSLAVTISLVTANFSGTVKRSIANGATTVAGVIVSTTVNGNTVSAVTDQNGNFSMNLPSGTYTLTALPPYGDSSDAVSTTLGVIVPSGNVTLNLG